MAARDIRSSLGKNIKIIRDLTGLDPWIASKQQMRSALELGLQTRIPEADFWRTRYLAKLLAEKSEAYYRADEEEVGRLTSLIESLGKTPQIGTKGVSVTSQKIFFFPSKFSKTEITNIKYT